MCTAVFVCVLLLFLTAHTSSGVLQTDYMDKNCGKTISHDIGGSIEIEKALTYSNGMDCTVTIQVAPSHYILLLISRFELEDYVAGECVDYLIIHDGNTTDADMIRGGPLCGEAFSDTSRELTLSTNTMVLRFVSDARAVKRGFQIYYVACYPVPCADQSDYICSNGRCISSTLVCDNIDHCGDNSDEKQTACPESAGAQEDENAPLGWILGGVFGGVALIVIIIIVYKVVVYLRWRAWLKSDLDNTVWEDTRPVYEYPITDKYVQFDVPGTRGRRGVPGYPGMQSDDHDVSKPSVGDVPGYSSVVSYQNISPEL